MIIRKIVGNNILIENVTGFLYQVVPVLGMQRLMGPKVVGFLSEKFVTSLHPTILLCRKRLMKSGISGGIFKNCTQKPPGKDIEGVPRTQGRKKACSIQMQM